MHASIVSRARPTSTLASLLRLLILLQAATPKNMFVFTKPRDASWMVYAQETTQTQSNSGDDWGNMADPECRVTGASQTSWRVVSLCTGLRKSSGIVYRTSTVAPPLPAEALLVLPWLHVAVHDEGHTQRALDSVCGSMISVYMLGGREGSIR